jgi:hypothetical protein
MSKDKMSKLKLILANITYKSPIALNLIWHLHNPYVGFQEWCLHYDVGNDNLDILSFRHYNVEPCHSTGKVADAP